MNIKKTVYLIFIVVVMGAGCMNKPAFFNSEKTFDEVFIAYKECDLVDSDNFSVFSTCMMKKGYDLHNVHFDNELKYMRLDIWSFWGGPVIYTGIAGK
jgi:hypothetical protein